MDEIRAALGNHLGHHRGGREEGLVRKGKTRLLRGVALSGMADREWRLLLRGISHLRCILVVGDAGHGRATHLDKHPGCVLRRAACEIRARKGPCSSGQSHDGEGSRCGNRSSGNHRRAGNFFDDGYRRDCLNLDFAACGRPSPRIASWRFPSALALGLGVVALPPIVFRLGSLVKKALPKVSTAALKPCRWKTVGVGALFITVGWLMVGLSLAAVLAAMHQLPPLALHLSGVEAFAVLTAAIALATVGGFVSFTPGGLGAREWILAEMLTPVIGSEHAIVGAVMLRIVWIVTEAAAAGVLLIVDRQWNRSRTNPS